MVKRPMKERTARASKKVKKATTEEDGKLQVKDGEVTLDMEKKDETRDEKQEDMRREDQGSKENSESENEGKEVSSIGPPPNYTDRCDQGEATGSAGPPIDIKDEPRHGTTHFTLKMG